MKSVLKISLLATAVAFAAGCQKEEAKAAPNQAVAVEAVTLTTDDQKAAYAIGASLAQYLKANLEQQAELGLKLDNALVIKGVQDTFAGKPQMTQDQTQATLQALDKRVADEMEAQAKQKAEVAKKSGDEYRTKFKATNGVKATNSGLLYQVNKLGEGKKPTAKDTVVVHYKGSLPDGTTFDSSYERNEPVTFPLDRVIPGWTEGVQLMPIGSKFTFVIPPELGYGDQNTPTIPANSTLVFEVELLDINPEAKVKTPKPTTSTTTEPTTTTTTDTTVKG